MTSKAPMTGLVTDSAETLAEALGKHREWSMIDSGIAADGEWAWLRCTCGWTLNVELPTDDLTHAVAAWEAHVAAALVTSGAVRPAAEVRAEMAGVLAGDETLVEAGARAFYEGFDSNPHHRRQWPAPKQHIPWWMARARDVISAVAAALAEEGGDRG